MTQTLLVTGAGSGIGRATARAFMAAGWHVALEKAADGGGIRLSAE